MWERLQRDVQMAKDIETFQSIKGDLDAACRADNEAQRALWQEKSLARRQGRRPDPRFAQAWVATGDRIHQLKVEHGLHAPRPNRNEYYFDPDLAFGPAPLQTSSSKSVIFSSLSPSSSFRRQP